MTMMIVLLKSCGKSFTSLKSNLNEPAEPPKSKTFDSANLRAISLSGANFLVYVFLLIDHFKLLAEVVAADGFLITQTQVT